MYSWIVTPVVYVMCQWHPCNVLSCVIVTHYGLSSVIATLVMCHVSLSPYREALDYNVLGLKHAIEVARKMKQLQVRRNDSINDAVMVMILL